MSEIFKTKIPKHVNLLIHLDNAQNYTFKEVHKKGEVHLFIELKKTERVLNGYKEK